MTNDTNTKPAPKKPVFRKQLPGGISAAVFENTRDGRTYRSVNLQRSYKQNDKWNRMSMYLDHEHIPFIIEVLQGTWNFLNEFPVASHQTQNSDAEPVESLDQHDEAASEFEA